MTILVHQNIILFIASFVNLMWKMFHSTHAPSIHVHICNRGILTSDYNETRSHIIICALGISFCYRFFQSFSSTQSIHLSLYRVGVGRSWKRFCAEVFGNLLAFWQFANSRCVWVSTKWKLKSQPIDIDRDNVLHTSMPTINFWIFSHIFFQVLAKELWDFKFFGEIIRYLHLWMLWPVPKESWKGPFGQNSNWSTSISINTYANIFHYTCNVIEASTITPTTSFFWMRLDAN